MTNVIAQGQAARDLLATERYGILSTHSVDVAGYPFGSVTPYALDHRGEPLILISTLAQHTKNIQADPRVSLTVHRPAEGDPQAGERLTWLADASPVDPADEAAQTRYLAFQPQAADYFGVHDFGLYRLRLQRARYIGGFGRIFWVRTEDLVRANPFAETERGILAHMNADHRHNLLAYCRAFKGLDPQHASMVGLDAQGFHVLADDELVRFAFEAPIGTPEEARQALVALARQAAQIAG